MSRFYVFNLFYFYLNVFTSMSRTPPSCCTPTASILASEITAFLLLASRGSSAKPPRDYSEIKGRPRPKFRSDLPKAWPCIRNVVADSQTDGFASRAHYRPALIANSVRDSLVKLRFFASPLRQPCASYTGRHHALLVFYEQNKQVLILVPRLST